ncbi:MAG: hypothetical protein J6P83_01120 [Bacteroidales bacterium]|nr:hypothetical protein [Bacteroidales bacterium]
MPAANEIASTETPDAVRYAIVAPKTGENAYNKTQENLDVAFNASSDPYGFFGTYKLAGEVVNNAFYQDAKIDLVWHSGAFSVSGTNQVVFSRGNLQYAHLTVGSGDNVRPAQTWRFAKHQYDFVGGFDNSSNQHGNVVRDETGSSATRSNNENIGAGDYDGWIDLFGWGTGNYPTQTTTTNTWYTSNNGYHEWGVNNIVNSGKPGNTGWWTSLTHTEWSYLISRDNEGKVGLATITGVAEGTMEDDMPGLVLLPDNFTNPYSWKSAGSGTASHHANYGDNTYTLDQWKVMEERGAVFLPATGWRNGSDGNWRASITLTSRILEHGSYNASTMSTSAATYSLRFGTDYETHDSMNASFYMAPDNGHAVRLVHRL